MHVRKLVQRTAFHVRLGSIKTTQERLHVWIVKLDVQPALQVTTRVNVYCVLLANKRHELVALNVKIVVLVNTAMAAKNVSQVNIAVRLKTIQLPVVTVAVENFKQISDRQVAFRAYLGSINIIKEKMDVWIVKSDVQPISQAMIKVHVHYVLLVKRLRDLVLLSV